MAQDVPVVPEPITPILTSTCPTQVLGAFTATGLICTDLQAGEACIGNGLVEATAREGVSDFRFSQIGDKTPLTNAGEIRLRTLDAPNPLWSVVQAENNILTSGGLTNLSAKMLAFGDVTLLDDGDVAQVVIEEGNQRTATVLAERGLIIRTKPDPSGGATWQLLAGEQVIVSGQTVDKAWLRVNVPSGFGGSGWVYAYYMDVAGGQETLPFVDVNSPPPTAIAPPPPPEYGTMQAFKLLSVNTDPSCIETPDSGVLLQSPNGMLEEMKIRVNGVRMEFNGTIFLQAQANGELRVSVLEGAVFFIEASGRVTANANTVGIVNMGSNLEPLSPVTVVPLNLGNLAFLPASLLPRTVALLLPEGVVTEPAIAETTEEPTPEVVTTEAAVTTGVTGFATATPQGFEAATVATEETPTEAPTSTGTGSLVSTVYGEVCGGEPLSISQQAPDFGFSADVGGLWTAATGTNITIEVLGGTFQENLGDFIRLLSVQGIVAQSGDQQQLTTTFTQDVRFSASFSSKAGDTLLITIRCN